MRSARAAGWRAVLSHRTRFASCCASGASPRAAREHVRQPPRATGMTAHSDADDLAQPGEIPRQLLEYLAECLVDSPEKVSVERFEGDGGTDERPIVRLQGVDDRASAEELRGLSLTVLRRQEPTLAPGEWWSRELESCEVWDRGRRIGTVARVLELPSCEALEVRLISGGDPLLVPMVKDAELRVDTARGTIERDGEFLGLASTGADAAVRAL